MRVLRQLFGLNKIYETKHGFAFFMDPMLVGALLYAMILFVEAYAQRSMALVTSVIVVALAAYFLREFIKSVYAWHLTRQRQYIPLPFIKDHHSNFAASAINKFDKDKVYKYKTSTIEEGPGWKLYDAEFSIFRKTKHGEYKAKELHYTVFEAKLQRTIPHVIFDSKSAKGNQFRYSYLQSQRISFEGNVDRYFETYAPQTYHIDALSFLTPEVLIELVRMIQFDVEFLRDSLLCYAPLLEGKRLEEFKLAGLRLHASVNDNLHSYRDDRLLGKARVSDVTDFGRQLLMSPMRYVPIFLLALTGTQLTLYLGSRFGWQILMSEVSLIAWALFFTYGYKIVRIQHDNRRTEKNFERHKKLIASAKKQS